MRRQRRLELSTQVLGETLPHRFIGHHIGDQALAAASGAFLGHHHRFTHAVQGLQAGFDFTQFDAEAADLHLVVDTVQVIESAIGALAHQVAGAVEQAAAAAERVGDKALGGQARTVQVTPRQPGATQVQFAGHALGQQVQVGVEHVGAAVADAAADGCIGGATGHVTTGFPDQWGDHGFGRAIAVDDEVRIEGALDPFEAGVGHRIAAEAVDAHLRRVALALGVLGQLLQVHRRERHYRHAVLAHRVVGLFRGPQAVVANQQRSTVGQAGEPAFMGTVEGERHEMEFAITVAHLVALADGLAVHRQRTMGHADTFGVAGGTGGVDDIGQVLRIDTHGWGVARLQAQVQAIEFQQLGGACQGQLRRHSGVGEQQRQPGIFHQVRQAFAWVTGVQRHIGRASLEHCQQRDDPPFAARQGHTNAGFRPHATGNQGVGQLVGAPVDVAIAETLAVEDHRRSLGLLRRQMGDALMHGDVGRVRLRKVGGLLPGLFLGADQGDLPQVAHRRLGEAFQQLQQMRADAFDGRRAEMCPVKTVVQRQGLAEGHGHAQRVMGLLQVSDFAKHRALPGTFCQGLGNRVVLEHQDVVEQRFPALPGPALDVRQCGVLEFAQAEVLRLHGLQPGTDRLVRTRRGDHRQGVDEQANLLLDARQIRRTPSHGGTEGDAVMAGVALQQQQPRRLHQGVEGDFLLAGELFQGLGARSVEGLEMVAVAAVDFADGYDARQPGWLLQGCQLVGPERLAQLSVLALQPGDVVAITPDIGLGQATAVALQDFAEQLGVAPAVHQDVVMGVDQVPALGLGLHQHQAQQWRLGQIEALAALGLGALIQGLGEVIAPAPIEGRERQLDLSTDDLQRLLKVALPDKAAAQDFVGVEGGLPGVSEALGIDALDVHPQLVDVLPRRLLVQSVEQQALLHR